MTASLRAGQGAIPPEFLNQIVTGDARVLAERIPDESVDLVFTDPVYDRIEDYQWLAETAARVLKPDSACLVWIASPRIGEVMQAIGDTLHFVMPLSYIRVGGASMMFSRKVFGWSNTCLWYERGMSKLRHAIPDTILSSQVPAGHHKWNKNPEALAKWMDAFTAPGSIVYDPFTGGGTVPAVCKMLGRNFIASEIDPDTAERARLRLEQTQVPLFVLEPEQDRMSFEVPA